MTYTVESFCQVVGLVVPAEFKNSMSPYYPRRSGRTTEMLVNACIAASRSSVLILGHNLGYTKEIQQEAKRMCDKADIDTNNIIETYVPLNESPLRWLRGRGIFLIFMDHKRIEEEKNHKRIEEEKKRIEEEKKKELFIID